MCVQCFHMRVAFGDGDDVLNLTVEEDTLTLKLRLMLITIYSDIN